MPNPPSPRTAPVTEREAFEACDLLAQQKPAFSVDDVLEHIGRGSKTTINGFVQRWRAIRVPHQVAPNIPMPVLESLNNWFADQRAALEEKAVEEVRAHRAEASALRQQLDAESRARVVAEEASSSLRAHVAQLDIQVARAEAETRSTRERAEAEARHARERQTSTEAQVARLTEQLAQVTAAKDAAVKAEGERVAAQMQSMVDRAQLQQDEYKRRAEAAQADARAARDDLTKTQVELVKAKAETDRVQADGQRLYDQTAARAAQAEGELERLRSGGDARPRSLDDLSVRAGKVVTHLVEQFVALKVDNKGVVDFARAAGSLSPIEAYSALVTIPEEVLRRRGSSIEKEVSSSQQDAGTTAS